MGKNQMKKHYKTLGLKKGASQKVIQQAYEKLSNELKPENNDHQEFFKEEYEKVQVAYEALSNSSILATEKGVQVHSSGKKSSSKKEIEKYKEVKKRNTSKIPSVSWVFSLFVFFVISLFLASTSVYLVSLTFDEIRNDTLIKFFTFQEDLWYHNDLFLPGNSVLKTMCTFLISFLFYFFLLVLIKFMKGSTSFYYQEKILTIISRIKKSLIFFIISVPLNKLLIHYVFHPILTSHIIGSSPRVKGFRTNIFGPDVVYHRSEKYRDFVGEHLKVLFDDQLMLFIPAIILSLLLIWFFNNYKIKSI